MLFIAKSSWKLDINKVGRNYNGVNLDTLQTELRTIMGKGGGGNIDAKNTCAVHLAFVVVVVFVAIIVNDAIFVLSCTNSSIESSKTVIKKS